MLAEPNLTAMSGETANFLAGGQVPVITPQQNGSFSVQYVSYGISLEFTPTLVGENRINLHVKPEVSEPSTVGEVVTSEGTITAFTTRKAETTVELGSGQSFAIAGLLDNSQNQAIDKFPFLGDVPILGPLFRSSDFQNDQSELIIIVTPYVVKAGTSEQAMALPTDGYSPPSDSELLLGLRNSSGDPNARPMSGSIKAAPVAPNPNPGTSMIDPSAVQPSKVPATALSNLGVDLPPENSAQNDDDAPVPPVPATALSALAGSLPVAGGTHDAAPPPIPDPVASVAPASLPIMPVAPASVTVPVIAKTSASPSSSPSGFILE
jgi:pilus assembly protein CpaC